MNFRRLCGLCGVAMLGACAQGGAGSAALPRGASAPHAASSAPAAAGSAARPAGVAGRAAATPVMLSMTPIGDMLRRVGAQSQAQAEAEAQRLRALGAARSALQRVQLAYLLLMAPAPGAEQAGQALDLLEGLDRPDADDAARQFVRVLQRLARQTLQLAQQRAELGRANRQITDLQDKIVQIRNLELQLQDRRKQGQTP